MSKKSIRSTKCGGTMVPVDLEFNMYQTKSYYK